MSGRRRELVIEKKTLMIELSGDEAEKIISEWVAARMFDRGYRVVSSSNNDGPWPDTEWSGEEIKGE